MSEINVGLIFFLFSLLAATLWWRKPLNIKRVWQLSALLWKIHAKSASMPRPSAESVTKAARDVSAVNILTCREQSPPTTIQHKRSVTARFIHEATERFTPSDALSGWTLTSELFAFPALVHAAHTQTNTHTLLWPCIIYNLSAPLTADCRTSGLLLASSADSSLNGPAGSPAVLQADKVGKVSSNNSSVGSVFGAFELAHLWNKCAHCTFMECFIIQNHPATRSPSCQCPRLCAALDNHILLWCREQAGNMMCKGVLSTSSVLLAVAAAVVEHRVGQVPFFSFQLPGSQQPKCPTAPWLQMVKGKW